MTESESWAVRSRGTADGIVLAVDFPGTGRPEAGFTELASKWDSPYALWETLPPPLASGVALSGAEWIDRWLEDVRESGRPVRAVMAFCASSPYAAILSDRVAQFQDTVPRTIFFDPDIPQEFFLHWQYQMITERFLTELTPEEKSAARERGERARETATDVTALGTELIALFREYGAPACRRAGLDAERTKEYLAGFTTYISFVCGSSQVATDDPDALVRVWSKATAVTSAGSGEAARLVGEQVAFPDVAHADLLGHEKVAAAVANLLAD
ncbi:hypothetical protein [Streptomyces sp. NPDC059651]|uniref:hypothetical protein n=1 Tax=unclassified Streptomyces TaxID=2593676 RepID=UPI000AD977D3